MLSFNTRRATPIVRQGTATECGLACLVMVANYHGYNTDLSSLRRRFPASARGATLKNLLDLAGKIGLGGRALRVEISDLRALAVPAVLHWGMNHFVVLIEVVNGSAGRGRYIIHDPATGRHVIDSAGLSSRFTGIVAELEPTATFLPANDYKKVRIRELWSRLDALIPAISQTLVLTFLLQALVLAAPALMQLAIDEALPSSDFGLLILLASGLLVVATLSGLTSFLRGRLLINLSAALSYQVVVNVMGHLLRLRLRWFEDRHVGDVTSRLGSTRPISDLLTKGGVAAFLDGLMAATILPLMLFYSAWLTSITVAAATIHFGLRLSLVPSLNRRAVDSLNAVARQSSILIETIQGMSTIKVFGQEGDRLRLWQNRKADETNAEIRLGRTRLIGETIDSLLPDLENIVFVGVAIGMAITGRLSVGMIFALIAYKQSFLRATTRLTQQAVELQSLDVHLERLADVIREPPELSISGEWLADCEGALELRNVWFRYSDDDPYVLQGVNLHIRKGETLAIGGVSGGGKTTLLKVMLGLFEPTSGDVLVDGRRLDNARLGGYRASCASVAQDDVLYSGSLAENIAFFDADIDMEKVIAAARLAWIDDDINRMPMRYETIVGDMGSVLSGGQKQRLFIARALYRNPRYLFIDEGTAHLDVRLEREVNQAIRDLGMTRIIIAHRPETLLSADRVVTVADGKIGAITLN